MFGKGKDKTDSAILTMPLQCSLGQVEYLDKLFRVCGELYNNLVTAEKKSLTHIERSREWKDIQNNIRFVFQEAENKNLSDQQKQILRQLYQKRSDILKFHGFSESAFQAKIQKWRKHHKKLVHTHVAQKIASAVWRKFEEYLFGSSKVVNFKHWKKFTSIEGKANDKGLRIKDGCLVVNKMKIPVVKPRNKYEQEAMKNRVKYCRIIRLPWKTRWLYRIQIVYEGRPPVKRLMSKGRVGIDIGTQTIAFVSGETARLEELAPKANMPDKQLRRINRAMDRSRRCMNHEFFKKDGSIVPIDKLPPECVDKNGKRIWKDSKRYKRLSQQRRYLYAKLTRVRKTEHNELANRILACGNNVYIEKMNFKALARKSRPQKPKDIAYGEKNKRRKRMGKSIANKAPAGFVETLRKKTLVCGGTFNKINTWKAKASQYNHLNHTYNKKKLSQRWNKMPDGRKIQRDLYSAFLIMNTNDTLDGFDQNLCEATYKSFTILHDIEIKRLHTIKTPSSTGVKCA